MKTKKFDVKFMLISLFLAAGVLAILFFISSSSIGAEDFVTEYTDDLTGETTIKTTTKSTTATTTSKPTEKAPVKSTTKAPTTTIPMPNQTTTTSATMPTVNQAAIGSSSDPLITYSYLRNIFMPELESIIMAKISGSTSAPQTTTAAPQSNVSYVPVELKKDQRIRSKSGSLELILRPGSAAVILSPFAEQGLSDITDGKELLNGVNVPLNHYLLIPRADDRGILITSEKAYVMIRGDYEIY